MSYQFPKTKKKINAKTEKNQHPNPDDSSKKWSTNFLKASLSHWKTRHTWYRRWNIFLLLYVQTGGRKPYGFTSSIIKMTSTSWSADVSSINFFSTSFSSSVHLLLFSLFCVFLDFSPHSEPVSLIFVNFRWAHTHTQTSTHTRATSIFAFPRSFSYTKHTCIFLQLKEVESRVRWYRVRGSGTVGALILWKVVCLSKFITQNEN